MLKLTDVRDALVDSDGEESDAEEKDSDDEDQTFEAGGSVDEDSSDDEGLRALLEYVSQELFSV